MCSIIVKMAENLIIDVFTTIFLLTLFDMGSVYNMELPHKTQISMTNKTIGTIVEPANRTGIVEGFANEEGEEIDLADLLEKELKELHNNNFHRDSTWTVIPTNSSRDSPKEDALDSEGELKEGYSSGKTAPTEKRFSRKREEDELENELKEVGLGLSSNITRPTAPTGADRRDSRDISNKLKNMWAKMKGKQASGNWDLSSAEASAVFSEYNDCITKRLLELTDLETGKLKPVHAIMALDGERITMKCTVCSRPDRDKHSQKALWQHIRRSDSTLSLLLSNKRVTQTSQGALIIKEVQTEDAGQYTCLDSLREFVAIYQLDVKFKERRKIVRLGEPLHNVTFLEDHNLKVMTSWSKWGACDSCGVVGSQQRLGTCMVKKINRYDPVKPKDFPMLLLYPDGIPCHSTALPVRIRRLRRVHARYEETLVRPCNVSCPTQPPPVLVTDSDGQVVETIPGGQLFDIGEKPALPPMVKRRVLFEPEGKHLILQCSDVERGSGIRWMRGKRRIDPLSIKRQTAGRVWVDSANRLHIAMLLLSDTAVYNCWERQRHVVAIKVLVVDGFNEQLKDYITYAGFGVTIFATLVACCCLCGSGKKTAK